MRYYAVMLLILLGGKPRPQHSKVPSVGKPSHQTLLHRVLLFSSVFFGFFFAYFFTIHLKGLGTRLAYYSLVPRPCPSCYARERLATIEAFLVVDDVELIIFTRRVT